MKKIVFLLLFAALFLAGCTHDKPAAGGEKKDFADCKKDVNCLKSEVEKSCGPAKTVVERFGVTVYAEVTPKEKDCNLFVQLQDIQLPPEASAEDKRTLAALRPLFPLASMECELKKSDARLLEDPRFLSREELLDRCSGLLKDQIVEKRRLFVLPTPTTRATSTPASTPSPTAASNATPTPTDSATPTPAASASPTPAPTAFPVQPLGSAERQQWFWGGNAIEYYAPTQTVITAAEVGINGFRLNNATNFSERRLWGPVPRRADQQSRVSKLKLEGSYLYAITRRGLEVHRFFPENSSISEPFFVLPHDGQYSGFFDVDAQGNSAYVLSYRGLTKTQVSGENLSVVAQTNFSREVSADALALKDGHVFVAGRFNSTSTVFVFSPALELLYRIDSNRFRGVDRFWDLIASGSHLFLAGDGWQTSNGVFTIDATNPANASITTFTPFPNLMRQYHNLYATPTRLYAVSTFHNQTQYNDYGFVRYFAVAERPPAPAAFRAYALSGTAPGIDPKGVTFGVIADEQNPHFSGGVAGVITGYTGIAIELGLLPQ